MNDGQVESVIDTFLRDYVKFMITPDSHNDVYAATAHRMFFANYVDQGRPSDDAAKLRMLADNDGHNTDSIDGLINVLPVAIWTVGRGPLGHSDDKTQTQDKEADVMKAVEFSKSKIVEHFIDESIQSLRRSKALTPYGVKYTELISRLCAGEDLREAILAVAPPDFHESLRQSVNSREKDDPMSACYVDSNFPVTLWLAYKYADDPNKCLLANANAGGENVNRGAVLGGIMGAAHGMGRWDPALLSGLTDSTEIKDIVDEFVTHALEE